MNTPQKPLKPDDFSIEKYLHICADMAGNPDVDMTIDHLCITVPPTKADLHTPEADARLRELVAGFKTIPHIVNSIDNGNGADIGINGYFTDKIAAHQGLVRCDFPELTAYANPKFYKEHQLEINFLLCSSLWLGVTLNCGDEFLTDLSPKNWIFEEWWLRGDLRGSFTDIRQELQRYV
ncbi:MAG: hypothetical protein IJP92_12690 [Lachnospiraceae bacterium]|nr:hypothetical protein [Lachnospiraceae bacterium]